MTVEITLTDLQALIEEEVSRVASRSYSEQGGSLYDAIKVISRDRPTLSRMLNEANSVVVTTCHRFLDHDTDAVEQGKLKYGFTTTAGERRTQGKEAMVTDLIRNALMKMVVSKFFLQKGMDTEAQKYDQQAAADLALLQKNIYGKLPPKFPES